MSAQPLMFPSQPAPPVSLVDKYRPRQLADFAGLEKPRRIMAKLAARPYSSNWIFTGASGTGKTTLALALAESIPAQIQHIASQDCTVSRIETVWANCFYLPEPGKRFHVVLVDEADTMSKAAQDSLLSKLDGTTPAPDTIWIFTCNSTERFEPRFLSRNRVLEFSSYGIAKEATALLERIWQTETDGKPETPNFARIIKENNSNIRAALMDLELALLMA
jgi:replication-associated recombination protein RarA